MAVSTQNSAYTSCLFPVMPHINLSSGSGSFWRKSTQVMPRRNTGNLGNLDTPDKITGMTGQFLFTNSRIYASSSICCHGPIPDGPRNTAAVSILSICVSNSRCQGMPGGSSHSSSQGRRPFSCNCNPISFTADLSSELWHRKTWNLSSIGLFSTDHCPSFWRCIKGTLLFTSCEDGGLYLRVNEVWTWSMLAFRFLVVSAATRPIRKTKGDGDAGLSGDTRVYCTSYSGSVKLLVRAHIDSVYF